MRALQLAWMLIAAAAQLFFIDAPALTFRQRFSVERPAERILLVSFELNLVLSWALAKFYLRWDRPLVPPSFAVGVAILGLAFTAAGTALQVSGKLRLGRWFSATFGVKEGHVLITDGPYAIVRHPIYAGLLTILGGGALAWNSALLLALALGMSVPLFFHTAMEEALFERHFGDAYREYQRRVPRLLPWPRPKSPNPAP